MKHTPRKEGSRKKGLLTRNIIRMLRLGRTSEEPSSVQGVPNGYHNFNVHAWKTNKIASLEAERRKAEALNMLRFRETLR